MTVEEMDRVIRAYDGLRVLEAPGRDELSKTALRDELSQTALRDELSQTALRDELSQTALRDELSQTAQRDELSQTAQPDLFYLYDPAADLPPERQQPFATIVTGDHYENVSRLDEPGAWRLNIGLTKATYTSLFGPVPTERDADWVLDSGHDYTARDTLMPHPFYASQHWVCIVSPSGTAPLLPLLQEAYDFAVRKHANFQARRSSPLLGR